MYLGISKRMVSHWMKKGKIRQNPDGSFDREELDRFRRERSGKDKEEEDDVTLKKWRAKHQELIVGQLEAQLVPKDQVEREYGERAYELKSGLYMMIRRIAAKLAGRSKKTMKEVEAIMREEIDLLLKQYSRGLKIKKGTIKR